MNDPLLHQEGGVADRRLALPDVAAILAKKRESWLDRMKSHAARRWERIVSRRTRSMRFVPTMTVTKRTSTGQKVDLIVARKRSGGYAHYPHGTGPHHTNRALRRSNGTRVQ